MTHTADGRNLHAITRKRDKTSYDMRWWDKLSLIQNYCNVMIKGPKALLLFPSQCHKLSSINAENRSQKKGLNFIITKNRQHEFLGALYIIHMALSIICLYLALRLFLGILSHHKFINVVILSIFDIFPPPGIWMEKALLGWPPFGWLQSARQRSELSHESVN